MRIVFMGTSDFAAHCLQRLLSSSQHQVVGIFTQPPRPARRGKKIHRTPVHECADMWLQTASEESEKPTLLTPETFRAETDQGASAYEALKALDPDICVVVAYGLILPQAILDMPRYGCVNLHASLLPRWRGAAPIQRAIMAGDNETGVQLMQMEAGLDTGPILATERLAISPQDTGGTLGDRLAECGAAMLGPSLTAFEQGKLFPIPQSEDGVCYASKITAADRKINFEDSAQTIVRQIAALAPSPGARAEILGQPLKILQASVVRASIFPAGDLASKKTEQASEIQGHSSLLDAPPGTRIHSPISASDVNSDALIIATGEDAIRIEMLQPDSGRVMTSADWLRGIRNERK